MFLFFRKSWTSCVTLELKCTHCFLQDPSDENTFEILCDPGGWSNLRRGRKNSWFSSSGCGMCAVSIIGTPLSVPQSTGPLDNMRLAMNNEEWVAAT